MTHNYTLSVHIIFLQPGMYVCYFRYTFRPTLYHNLQPGRFAIFDKPIGLNRITFYNLLGLLFQVHAYIISHLKKEMPSMFGKDSKKKELIAKLADTYRVIQRDFAISPGDFPSLEKMQQSLEVVSIVFLCGF